MGVGLVFAVVAVTALALSVVGNIASKAIPSRQRIFSAPVTAVTVNISSGSVTVESSSRAGAVVTSSGNRGVTSPTDMEHVSGRTLVVRSTCGSALFDNHCSRNYVLNVNPAVSVVVDAGEGDIAIDGINGPRQLHTDEGGITVTGGSGQLRATSSEGDVSASNLTSRTVAAHSDEGDVDLGFVIPPATIAASSSEGNVSVDLPRGPASYQVHVSSDQGNATNSVTENSSSGRVIQASSDEGDVSVAYNDH